MQGLQQHVLCAPLAGAERQGLGLHGQPLWLHAPWALCQLLGDFRSFQVGDYTQLAMQALCLCGESSQMLQALSLRRSTRTLTQSVRTVMPHMLNHVITRMRTASCTVCADMPHTFCSWVMQHFACLSLSWRKLHCVCNTLSIRHGRDRCPSALPAAGCCGGAPTSTGCRALRRNMPHSELSASCG